MSYRTCNDPWILIVNSGEGDLHNQAKNKLLVIDELDQGCPLILKLMMDIIFSVTDYRLAHMKVAEYSGEDIFHITKFVHEAYTILHNCEFIPPDVMQILYDVLCTASDDEFVKHMGTIKTNQQLNLLPDMTVETFLDNVKSYYIAKKTAETMGKGLDLLMVAVVVEEVRVVEDDKKDVLVAVEVASRGKHPDPNTKRL
eukprot:14473674-Ditylum_brightwellii.AAC.1